MPQGSIDYFFTATRRGRDVVIKGVTQGPPNAEAYLIASPIRDAQVRSFRVAFRNNNNGRPWVAYQIEHREPDVPADVLKLAIHLPTDDIFEINSQHAATVRMTPEGTVLRYVGEIRKNEVEVMLERIALPLGVLDAIGNELKDGGFRGRLYVGTSAKSGEHYFSFRPPMERPFAIIVSEVDLSTPDFAKLATSRFLNGWRFRRP